MVSANESDKGASVCLRVRMARHCCARLLPARRGTLWRGADGWSRSRHCFRKEKQVNEMRSQFGLMGLPACSSADFSAAIVCHVDAATWMGKHVEG